MNPKFMHLRRNLAHFFSKIVYRCWTRKCYIGFWEETPPPAPSPKLKPSTGQIYFVHCNIFLSQFSYVPFRDLNGGRGFWFGKNTENRCNIFMSNTGSGFSLDSSVLFCRAAMSRPGQLNPSGPSDASDPVIDSLSAVGFSFFLGRNCSSRVPFKIKDFFKKLPPQIC